MELEEILKTLREQIDSLKAIKEECYINAPQDVYAEVQSIAEKAGWALDDSRWALESLEQKMQQSQDDEDEEDDDDDDERIRYEEELETFKKAANKGDTNAMMALAEIYNGGDWRYGMNEPDIPSAIEWYKKAADKGVTDAMMALGEIYDRDSKDEAAAWYEKAFDADDKRAAGALMQCFYWAKDYAKVYEWIQKGKEQDAESPDVLYFLGLLHMKENGPVPQDSKRAQEYLEKAAEAGNSSAMLVIGDMYRDGIGVDADREKALALYKKVKDKEEWEASMSYWKLKEPEINDWFFEVMRDVLESQLGVEHEDVQRDSRFIDDLGADSLDIVEIIMAVEETWWVEIHDEEAEEMRTVQDMVDTLIRKYQQGECHFETGERPLEILYSRNRKTYLRH